MFISRVELLPEDETTNEHDEAKREETQQIETDKATGGQGLFKGAFTQSKYPGGARFMQVLGAPIRDVEDGVDRCPVCAWELEDGECNHCGYNDDDDEDFSDDDDETRSLATPSIISINDSELDGEIDLEDHDLDVTDYDEDGFAVHDRFSRHPANADVSSVAAEYPFSEDDDGESEMSDAPRRSMPRIPQAWTRLDRTIRDEDDQSEGDDTEVPDEPNGTEISDDEDEDSDGESMSHGSVGTYETLSDSESDRGRYEGPFNHLGRDETPSVAEPRSPSSFYADAITAGDPGYGFSPPSAPSPDSTIREPTPRRESNVEVVRQRNRNGIPRRPARVVISSDDESDDSTPTPPRPAGDRRAHLQGQRARRGGASGTRTAQRHYRGR